MFILNTITPYKTLDRCGGIQYSVCREFDHLSRYRCLRQVSRDRYTANRYVALETPNPAKSYNMEFAYHEVVPDEENRLDVIAHNLLGSASYGWVVAYYNSIEDGFTVKPGQVVRVPKDVYSLLSTGNILQSVPAMQLNLGSEP